MNRKRASSTLELEGPSRKEGKAAAAKHYAVNKHLLAGLGGGWANMPPFAGDEDRLYRWIAEPALWARVVLDTCESRVQQRLVQLHAALHDGLDASGFICWRTLPPVQPPTSVTMKLPGVPAVRTQLPRVTIRQHKMTPSIRFGEGWESRSQYGPPPEGATPPWLRSAHRLVRQAEFNFLGAPMAVVDDSWATDRFSRPDAVLHALCEMGPGGGSDSSSGRGGGGRGGRRGGGGGGGNGGSSGGGSGGSTVAAAMIETPFPAERLLRSLVNAGKEDDVLYIDVIVADRYGAAYRLLCDIIAARQALQPERRLVVVLMAVVSSDVISRYARWGFSYGGVIGTGDGGPPPLVIDRIDRLHKELSRFEAAMARPTAPSPCSVVEEPLPLR